eukprot:UN04576
MAFFSMCVFFGAFVSKNQFALDSKLEISTKKTHTPYRGCQINFPPTWFQGGLLD